MQFPNLEEFAALNKEDAIEVYKAVYNDNVTLVKTVKKLQEGVREQGETIKGLMQLAKKVAERSKEIDERSNLLTLRQMMIAVELKELDENFGLEDFES